ncbi:MAG: hypothetical protein R2883_08770 [Caldisericia bacterium]
MFPDKLSNQGLLDYVEDLVWKHKLFPSQTILSRLWDNKEKIKFCATSIIALIGELAIGNIELRPWALVTNDFRNTENT